MKKLYQTKTFCNRRCTHDVENAMRTMPSATLETDLEEQNIYKDIVVYVPHAFGELDS